MTATQDEPPLRNPFSPMAVALIADSDEALDVDEDVTVTTDAIRRAKSYVAAYFAGRSGGLPALVGRAAGRRRGCRGGDRRLRR